MNDVVMDDEDDISYSGMFGEVKSNQYLSPRAD